MVPFRAWRVLIVCALPILPVCLPAQNATPQQQDSRPRKALDPADQLKILKAHDAFVTAAADAQAKLDQAQAAREQARQKADAYRIAAEQIKKNTGCVDFDTTGEDVRCITASTAPKSPAVSSSKPASQSPSILPPK